MAMEINSKKQTRNSKKEKEGKQGTLFNFESPDYKKEEVLCSAKHLTKGRPFTIKL